MVYLEAPTSYKCVTYFSLDYILGMIASAVLWGFLADKYGRKNTFIYASIADCLVGIFCSFATKTWVLEVLEFISGFA